MKSIKVIVKNYKTKDGKEFTTAKCRGQYLPFATAEIDVNYNVKFAQGGKVEKLPTVEGIYEVAYLDDKSIWIDSRSEMLDKHIVRVKVERYVYKDRLQVFPESKK